MLPLKTKTSLVVQWLRLHAPNAGDPGSIPDQGTSSHVLQLRVHTLQLKIPQAATKILHAATKTGAAKQINFKNESGDTKLGEETLKATQHTKKRGTEGQREGGRWGQVQE